MSACTQLPPQSTLTEVVIHPLSEAAHSDDSAVLEPSNSYETAVSSEPSLSSDDQWLSSCEMKQLLEVHVLPQLSFKDLCRLSMVSWAWRRFMTEHLTHVWRQAAYREGSLPPDISAEKLTKLDQGSVQHLKDVMLFWRNKRKQLEIEQRRAELMRQAVEAAAAAHHAAHGNNQAQGNQVAGAQQQGRGQNPSSTFMCFWLAISIGLNVLVWTIVAVRQ